MEHAEDKSIKRYNLIFLFFWQSVEEQYSKLCICVKYSTIRGMNTFH